MRASRQFVVAALRRPFLLVGIGIAAAVSLGLGLTLPGGAASKTTATPAAAFTPSSGAKQSLSEELSGAPSAASGRVIVVLKDQHSNLNLDKQGTLRRKLAFENQAPIIASIKAHGGNDILQLVAVNAVAAKLSATEVSRLGALPSVAKIVPDTPVGNEISGLDSGASASVPNSQVVPPATPAACPATTTSPTGVTNIVQEPDADADVNASNGIAGAPDEANTVLTGTSNAPATGTGVIIANNDVNTVATPANLDFVRPNGQAVAVNLPSNDTTVLQGNDEFSEDTSSMASQGTVVYQYNTGLGITTPAGATNAGALPFSNLPTTCRFYILGAAPGASLADDSDLTTPPTGLELESQIIAGIDRVTDAALPPIRADEISESYGSDPAVPQVINTANDAAVVAGVSVFVSAGDQGDSTQWGAGTTLDGLADDGFVMDLGATDDNRLFGLEYGFNSVVENQIGGISSGGVGTYGRVIDVLAPGWFGGEGNCVLNSGGCPSWYPTEAMRGTSESAPLTSAANADMIEAYRNTHNGNSPTPAMQEDIIDGTATDTDDPVSGQGSGLVNAYRAVEAAMQMPGTTDLNGPNADAEELVPSPSQVDFTGEPGTTTNQSVTLYNTNPNPTTVTGTWRNMGPQSNIVAPVTEAVSAPALGTPVPPQGATAAAPITFNVPAGLDRLEVKEVTPDPTNNTMLEIALFNPSGAYVQSSYDDGSTSQNVTALGASNTVVGATNIKVASATDAVVGNAVDIDTLGNAETDTVAAVGKAASSTTLTAASVIGATNIKVAADTNITAGDTLTIDTGASNESATVSAVGTPTVNTTLSAATAIGATNIHTATVTNITAGDTITLNLGATNQETATITAVGTSGATGTGLTLSHGLTFAHASAASVQDLGTGVTLTAGLHFAHNSAATVADSGSGITLTTPLTGSHASGATVFFQGTGTEPNTQEIEVSAPMPGTWTARILWNGIDQDVGDAPPEPGLYTGQVSVDFQGSQWQYSAATAPVTIAGHSSATIPITYQFPGTPGDYPQSIQFAATNGATTSFPFVGRTIIPTGFNVPFSALATTSVGRPGYSIVNYFFLNVPAGSQSVTVNLNTPDGQADNKFTYYLINNTDESSSCALPLCTRISEPVTGVNNGTLTIQNPTPGMWQVDVSFAQTLSGNEFTQVVNGTATVTPGVTPGATVASTLAVSLGSTTPSFGTFVPGTAANYTTTVPATVTSTAQTATLQASDGSTTFPGHLVNTSAVGGPYEMPQGLQVDATSSNASASGGGVYSNLATTNPATILTYNAPVSNDVATIGFLQPIAATDALRTGSYTKTITVTLSTNSP